MPHFQLVVPNYDQSTGADHPLTYVRLGQAWASNETLTEAQQADSLLTPHTSFKDDTRDADSRIKTGKTYYRDEGVSCVESTSAALTAELLTRGGVREHTDGDRISTTRGDYLGVVFGNYKLVVMGRVEGDHVGRSWWESSGGHNHDSTSTPGEVTSISWRPGVEDDTWEVLEETVKGEQWSYFQGRKETTFYGPTKRSTIGATTPPSIRDVTYCQQKEALEVYDEKTDTTTVNGDATEHAQVTTLASDRLYFNGTGTVTDTTQTLGTFSSHLLALPLITSQSLFGAHYERYGGNFTTKLILGAEYSLTVGAATTFRFFHFAFPITVASSLSVSLAGALSLEVGVTLKAVLVGKQVVGVDENVITLLDLKIWAAQKKLSALKTDVGATELTVTSKRSQQ